MCKFIGVEILAANAFIELLEKGKEGKVSFETLNTYGIKAIEFIEKTYKEKALILFDKNRVGDFIINYSDYFFVKNRHIFINDGVTAEMLRERFRGPLTYEVLKALISKDVVTVLDVAC